MRITCAVAQRAATLAEAPLDFADAAAVFAGLHAMLADDRMDYGDARYISAGYLGGPLVVPVWTPCGSARCIISMRHAHGKEEAAGSSVLDSGDDAPELTDAFFAAATVRDGDKVVRRGRPKLAAPKQLVTIRFPAETLGRLRAMGPGWQGGVVKAVERELDNPTASKMQPKKGTPNAPGSGVGAVRARRRDVA